MISAEEKNEKKSPIINNYRNKFIYIVFKKIKINLCFWFHERKRHKLTDKKLEKKLQETKPNLNFRRTIV